MQKKLKLILVLLSFAFQQKAQALINAELMMGPSSGKTKLVDGADESDFQELT